ncbi:MAG: dipeptidase [Xanthobacteraceae bacterium]
MGPFLVVVALLAGILIAWTILVQSGLLTVSRMVAPRPGAPPSLALTPQATDLHRRLRVMDLHCDALMWRRDLTRRSIGYLDFARMREGNCAAQIFLAVTEIPRQVSGDMIADKSNRLTLLGVLDQWPLGAVRDQTECALYMGNKLRSACKRTGGGVRFIQTARELRSTLDDRISNPGVCAAVLGLESSDATQYSIANFERLFAAGYCTSSLCHLTDTAFAASASGISKGGLTPLGREAVSAMNALGMIVDLAHASQRAIEDALTHSKRCPIITHTGARAVANDPKCQPDEILRAVVDKGGLIGLCFVADYVNGTKIDDILRSLEHLLRVVGPKGVALGSGFDSFPVPIAVDQLPYLTQALLSAGHDEATIGAIMGENALQFLLRELPQG